MNNFSDSPSSLRWYQKFWGVAGLVVGIAGLILISYFIFITARYYTGLKKTGLNLPTGLSGQFSSASSSPANNSVSVKRQDLEISDRPFRGNPGAKLVVVEFIDFKCPNCQKSEAIIKTFLSKYAYKIKLITRNFPMESVYAGTNDIAKLAYCADQQGLYWKMHDYLFANQSGLPVVLDDVQIKTISLAVGANYDTTKKCLLDDKTTAQINKDYGDGLKFGVNGTPTFFINGQKVQGVVAYDDWEKLIAQY
ncbi:MAG: hypothetical protein COU31_01785 [Candidatus Magasanikbacteria bacterium CG10_big_fil_rev_8_21_14_0_10_40_10]|uniref:Thioredoxin domain-containing protein n=1 Tax=Candidatus Magasanikbacteria bacterium CG10_big_fil_rev_8_21_14_0_10_40_10 TaxID=1974648 RepID=A0A2M6W4D3_9BACT|nr:MAG: hypothetical protein COU31_01785 [Candidatus Magasanikbacteria bacterium CG10_big_fil_rev_8_21_14_0_10_40_10]